MNCLVTGGDGFIGSHLVGALVKEGHNVRVLDMDTDFDWIDHLFCGTDVVFHLLDMRNDNEPIKSHDVNVRGTLDILEHCRRNGVKRLIYSSCSSVYGEPPERVLRGHIGLREQDPEKPMSPYGLQKLIGEQYCKLYSKIYDMECVALRYFNVYGERQPIEGAYKLVMGIFAEQKLKGEPLTIVGDGEQRRDFIHVDDVVEANLLAAEADFKGYFCFNIGSGDNRSVNQIAALFGGPTVNLPSRIEPRVTLAENGRARSALKWETTMTVEQWIPGWLKDMGIEGDQS